MIANGVHMGANLVRWLVSGVVLVAIYRGSIYLFSLVAAEIISVIGPQEWLSTACVVLALTGYGLLAEMYFGLIRERS